MAAMVATIVALALQSLSTPVFYVSLRPAGSVWFQIH